MTRKKRPSRAKVRRLRFYGPDGKPRQRPELVENEIADMLPLQHAERAAKAPVARNETLIYFIQRRDDASAHYYEPFVEEIDKRVADIAERYVRTLRKETGEDIVMKVQDEFRKLILAERASAGTEFLEIAFALAVKKRTLQLVSLYLCSPWSRRVEIDAPDAADDEDAEWRLDSRPGPEAELLALERKEFSESALDAITDPRHRKAAILHWLEGWPIVSKDKDGPDLITRFRTTEGRVKRWLKKAMEEMRAALGVGVTK